MKNTASKAAGRVTELEPFDKREVDLAKIKSDITTKVVKSLFSPIIDVSNVGVFQLPIDHLSPVKTVGRGRTNLTLIRPTILQTDATTPYAGFDRRESPSRNPAVQMHFEPKAYGITAVSSYIMSFKIEAVGAITFTLAGSTGFISNAGTRTVNGLTTVSLVFRNVPASAQIFGYLEQTAGGMWNWYSVDARFPALVVKA